MNIRDIATRAGWTAAQATVGVLAADLAGVSAWWALPLATGLSAVKTWIIGRNSVPAA